MYRGGGRGRCGAVVVEFRNIINVSQTSMGGIENVGCCDSTGRRNSLIARWSKCHGSSKWLVGCVGCWCWCWCWCRSSGSGWSYSFDVVQWFRTNVAIHVPQPNHCTVSSGITGIRIVFFRGYPDFNGPRFRCLLVLQFSDSDLVNGARPPDMFFDKLHLNYKRCFFRQFFILVFGFVVQI